MSRPVEEEIVLLVNCVKIKQSVVLYSNNVYFCYINSNVFMISSSQISERLVMLRKHKDYSQEELSEMIGITRSSLAQIELGKRSVSAEELMQFANVLNFSIDHFFSPDFKLETIGKDTSSPKKKEKIEERISVPKLNVDKFKQVLLYILEKCAGKPNVGETVLYKLLYFSEFNYYELYEEHMVGATFKKLPFGPVPRKLDGILEQMQEQGEMKIIKVPYFGKTQKRYIPLVKPDLRNLMASEIEVIDHVLEQLSDLSASMLSDYSHGDKPWKATKENDVIDYELVFYRRPPYSVRVYNDDEQN